MIVLLIILLGAILYAISPTVFFWVVGSYVVANVLYAGVYLGALVLEIAIGGTYAIFTRKAPPASKAPSQHPAYRPILKDEEP